MMSKFFLRLRMLRNRLLLRLRDVAKSRYVKPPICSICGRRMRWFDFGGVCFWYCDFDDNIVDVDDVEVESFDGGG